MSAANRREFVCPRGHRHYAGSAFCTVCGAGPVLRESQGRREWDRFMARAALNTMKIKLREAVEALGRAVYYARKSLT